MTTGTSTSREWPSYPGEPMDITPSSTGPLDITPTANRRGPAHRAIATAVAVAAGTGLLAGLGTRAP